MNKAYKMFWEKHLSKRFNGYVKILEFTFPDSTTAHPHFHILLSTNRDYFFKSNDNYLTTEDISKLWGRMLKVDYNPIVDVRIIKPKKTKGGYVSKAAIPAVVAEMTKYPMKDTDYNKLTPNTMDLLYTQLYRKRLIATGGNLKISINKIDNDLSLKDVDQEELDNWKQIAYVVMKYIHNGYVISKSDFTE